MGLWWFSVIPAAPVFFSKPSFYEADPVLLQHVSMLPPDPDRDETFLDVEPYTGKGFRVQKKLQFNLHLPANYEFNTENVRNNSRIFWPVVTIWDGGEVGDSFLAFHLSLVCCLMFSSFSSLFMLLLFDVFKFHLISCCCCCC